MVHVGHFVQALTTFRDFLQNSYCFTTQTLQMKHLDHVRKKLPGAFKEVTNNVRTLSVAAFLMRLECCLKPGSHLSSKLPVFSEQRYF